MGWKIVFYGVFTDCTVNKHIVSLRSRSDLSTAYVAVRICFVGTKFVGINVQFIKTWVRYLKTLNNLTDTYLTYGTFATSALV